MTTAHAVAMVWSICVVFPLFLVSVITIELPMRIIERRRLAKQNS